MTTTNVRKENGRLKRTLVHRWAYENLVGPIPEGLILDHLCRNTSCCNPKHLEAVPPRINVLRGKSPRLTAERNLLKTQCPKGHLYEGHNLILGAKLTLDGGRNRLCRICKNENAKLYRRRQKLNQGEPETCVQS